MAETLIDWSSPGNYLLPGVIIGLILFGLFIVNFVAVYFKYSRRASDNIDDEKNAYKNGNFVNQFPKRLLARK
jgi:hypothetical protein